MEQIVTSHGAEDIAFIRKCYGPITFKCSIVGCLHYDVGFEKLQERDSHVRSHSRPVKCPERGCFYGEVGFANYQGLNRHFSLCHTEPGSSKFLFPRLRDPRPPTEDEQKRFQEAIERENLDLVRDLIRRDSSLPGRVVLDGYTALQYAARHGKVGTALLLLHCGATIGTVNEHGTALNVACSYGQLNMVQLLLSNSKREEDLNSKDNRGDTPLLSIVGSEHAIAQLAIVQLLLADSRVFADGKNRNGRTPLSLAATNSARMVRVLLEHGVGVDVNAKDDTGRTPLLWAACKGYAEVVEVLLEHGVVVDANTKGDRGMTPLLWAASRGNARMVSALLAHGVGVDVNAKDGGGWTPLLWAASKGYAEVVGVLLEHGVGVDVNEKDDGGMTPLLWAADRGRLG